MNNVTKDGERDLIGTGVIDEDNQNQGNAATDKTAGNNQGYGPYESNTEMTPEELVKQLSPLRKTTIFQGSNIWQSVILMQHDNICYL